MSDTVEPTAQSPVHSVSDRRELPASRRAYVFVLDGEMDRINEIISGLAKFNEKKI